MLHIISGMPRTLAHFHHTSKEARTCEEMAALADAMADTYAEEAAREMKADADAFRRHFETNEQHYFEMEEEEKMEEWLRG